MKSTCTLAKSHKKSVYFLVFIVPFLMGLGVDLYVPSLPQIVNYFHTKTSMVQLTVSLYMLGYGVGQVILGVLSDSFGRRKILILSSISFAIISFICIQSPNLIILEICRLLQGISVAGLAVVSRAMIPDVFSGSELAKVTNYFTLSWSLGPIIAPFIGGSLANRFGWKSNFYLFTLYGLFIFVYSLIRYKETNHNLVPFNISKTASSLHEIFTTPSFMLITTISAIGYGTIVLFNVIGPFLIEVVLKYSTYKYGQFAMILGFAYCFGAMANRFAVNKFNSTHLLSFGLLVNILISIFTLVLSLALTLNLYAILIPTFAVFFFVGFIVPNALSQTMASFSNMAGTASAVFGTLTGIVVSFISAFGSTLKSNSQIPLSITYLFLFIISWLLFCISRIVVIKNKGIANRTKLSKNFSR